MPPKKQPHPTSEDDIIPNKRQKGQRAEGHGEATLPLDGIAPSTPLPAAQTAPNLAATPVVSSPEGMAQPIEPLNHVPPLAQPAQPVIAPETHQPPATSSCPVRLVAAADIAVKTNGRYARVTVPYRIHLRIIAVSQDNVITRYQAKHNQPPRQKMLAAGVQADGGVVLLEQWVDVPSFDEAVELEGSPYSNLSTAQQIKLSNNLNFLCTPKVDGTDVLISVVIGALESGTAARWAPMAPVASIHAANTYDDELWNGGVCKVKLPSALRRTVQAIELNQGNVTQYKSRFNGADPTTWIPVNQYDVVPFDPGLLTEEDFWAL